MEVDVRSFIGDRPPRPLIGSGGGTPTSPSESIAEAAQAAASEMVTDAVSPNASSGGSTKSKVKAESQSTIDLFGAEQEAAIESAAALDDDSFFASLRDAVRDDAPLGPRDASERAFFDQDSKDSPTFREAFKRRR